MSDAPVHGLPATIFATEDTDFFLNSGVAIDPPPAWISDPDSASVTTTLSVADGTFTATGWGGTVVTGSGTNLLTITGTPDEVNRTVYYLTSYLPASNVNGTRTLTVTTTDGTDSDSDTVTISIAAVKDTPEGADVTVSASEDTEYVLHASDFGFSDPDGHTLASIVITTLPLHGRLVDIGGWPVDIDITGDGIPDVVLGAPARDLVAGDTIDLALLTGNYIRYLPAANAYGVGADGFTYQVVDNGGTPTAVTIDPTPNTLTFDIAGLNDVPTLTDLAATLPITEGDPPTLVDADVTFTDPEDNFDGGTLVVSGALAEDVLSIQDEGAGAGQIGTSGSNVTYSGIAIGSYAGGAAGSDLIVTFNSAATAAAIERLIENLTYANDSDAPTASRTLTVTVTDAASDSSSQDITVDVTPVNDAPELDLDDLEPDNDAAASWTEGEPPVLLAPFPFFDDDNDDHDGATLTVAVDSAGSGDQLTILNSGTGLDQLGISGSDVTYEGVVVGTWSGGDAAIHWSSPSIPTPATARSSARSAASAMRAPTT